MFLFTGILLEYILTLYLKHSTHTVLTHMTTMERYKLHPKAHTRASSVTLKEITSALYHNSFYITANASET